MPALAGVFVTFASTAITAHRTHVMDCYASHSVQVLILPLRRTPVGVPETASNDLAMSLAGIGESSEAIMIFFARLVDLQNLAAVALRGISRRT